MNKTVFIVSQKHNFFMGGEPLGARKKRSQVPFDVHAKRKTQTLIVAVSKSQNEKQIV